jgi:hypothetical protein
MNEVTLSVWRFCGALPSLSQTRQLAIESTTSNVAARFELQSSGGLRTLFVVSSTQPCLHINFHFLRWAQSRALTDGEPPIEFPPPSACGGPA